MDKAPLQPTAGTLMAGGNFLHPLKERRAIENSYFSRKELKHEYWDSGTLSGQGVWFMIGRVFWIWAIPAVVLLVLYSNSPGNTLIIGLFFFLTLTLVIALLAMYLYVRGLESD